MRVVCASKEYGKHKTVWLFLQSHVFADTYMQFSCIIEFQESALLWKYVSVSLVVELEVTTTIHVHVNFNVCLLHHVPTLVKSWASLILLWENLSSIGGQMHTNRMLIFLFCTMTKYYFVHFHCWNHWHNDEHIKQGFIVLTNLCLFLDLLVNRCLFRTPQLPITPYYG